jgi:hypothetical protein
MSFYRRREYRDLLDITHSRLDGEYRDAEVLQLLNRGATNHIAIFQRDR